MTSLPIDLPEGFSPLIKEGDTVTIKQVLARKEAPKEETVNIIQSLRLSRARAVKALRKGPGEKIKPGDVIAVKKNFFGKVKTSIISSISGVILRYERDTGNLVVHLEADLSSLEIISPVAGTVTLCNNKEIVVETRDALISTGVGIGVRGEGELLILKESFRENNFDSALYYLDSSAVDKIVFVHTLTRELIIKGDSIGVVGFLGVTIANEEIAYLQQKDIKLPVLEVNDGLVSKLNEWENKEIMLDIRTKTIILKE